MVSDTSTFWKHPVTSIFMFLHLPQSEGSHRTDFLHWTKMGACADLKSSCEAQQERQWSPVSTEVWAAPVDNQQSKQELCSFQQGWEQISGSKRLLQELWEAWLQKLSLSTTAYPTDLPAWSKPAKPCSSWACSLPQPAHSQCSSWPLLRPKWEQDALPCCSWLFCLSAP